MVAQGRGIFIISLDFELHWGVRDVKTVQQYHENLLGVRSVVPALLATFAAYGIHATWATVGLLFFRSREELLRALPIERPAYKDERLSPYSDILRIGLDEDTDPYHFGRSLIDQIQLSPAQEIGTHTFSHYYCLEPMQRESAFRADLEAAFAVAGQAGITLQSIVFPRNQYDARSLRITRALGLKCLSRESRSMDVPSA